MGCLYKTTSEQLSLLKHPDSEHDPATRDGAIVFALYLSFRVRSLVFPAMEDVRLKQVRFWIISARVDPTPGGRQLLPVNIGHMSCEDFLDTSKRKLHFDYEVVRMML
jgi:hypothetical protein